MTLKTNQDKGILIVISGFSGAGKGTVVQELIKDTQFALSISATTRQPRVGETHGEHYFFLSQEKFIQMIGTGDFLEWAEFCNHHYGTPKKYVEDQLSRGKDVILEIEVQGALQVKKIFPECILVFVTPPSLKELQHRLEKRGTEEADVIKQRLQRAREEIDYMGDYDYIVVNDLLPQTVDMIRSIVNAEHFKANRNQSLIEELKGE